MKTIATLALLGLVAASEDNEFFKVNNTKLINQTLNTTVRPQPINVNQNKTQIPAFKPRPVHPILFNRTHPTNPKTKEWLNSKGPKALTKILSSYDDDELWNVDNIQSNDDASDNELTVVRNAFFSKVGNFVGGNKPNIVRYATNILGHFDDESIDSELASIQSIINKGKNIFGKLAGELDDELASISELLNKGKKIINKLGGELDDELTEDELAFLGSFTRVIQKSTANSTAGKKAVPFLALDEISEEELFNLDAFLNDAVRTYNDVRQTPRNYGNIVNDGIQLIKDIKQKKQDDEDEELFKLGTLIKDGANIYKDVKNKDYENLVNHGVQTIKDIKRHDDEELFKRKKHDDEELFKLDTLLNDAIKTYNDARQNPRDYGVLVNDGIQIVMDLKRKKQHDDEELFNLGTLIKDGTNIYKDVKNKDYGNLINHGIQTAKDIKKNLRH